MASISRGKDNKTMKLGQLIEYNMRNIFLEKSYIKCKMGWRSQSRTFYEKSKLSISLEQQSEFLNLFLLYVQIKVYQKCCPLAFTLFKAFLRNKKRSRTSQPISFSAWFVKKNISSHSIYYQLTKFHCLTAFTSWDAG